MISSVHDMFSMLHGHLLHQACLLNQPETVKDLITNGADIEEVVAQRFCLNDVNITFHPTLIYNMHTPLSLAMDFCLFDVLQILLIAGVNTQAVMENGATALHRAARAGFVDGVTFLLKRE